MSAFKFAIDCIGQNFDIVWTEGVGSFWKNLHPEV
jgi:hypothetical protein